MANIPKRVALVYDRANKWGGAEQVLLSLHALFPTAPLFTSVYDPGPAVWAKVFPEVIPTFLQNFPLASSHHQLYLWATPLAFESLDFSDFDAVISITSADAKGIITRPETFHLCYCLTPTRYLWSHPAVPWPLSRYLKSWDQVASARPDAYVAISQTVQDRLTHYYNRPCHVVYPPVDIKKYETNSPVQKTDDYFLWVGRLVYHKQPDLLVKIFNDLNLPLIMVGTGRLDRSLRQLARPNITFTGHITDPELIQLYHQANAYVSVHEEDFGMSYVEAQACGIPVIAINRGGVRESVTNHKTGLLVDSLAQFKTAITNFDRNKFDPRFIISSSQRFSKSHFISEFAKVFTQEWTKYKSTSTF